MQSSWQQAPSVTPWWHPNGWGKWQSPDAVTSANLEETDDLMDSESSPWDNTGFPLTAKQSRQNYRKNQLEREVLLQGMRAQWLDFQEVR